MRLPHFRKPNTFFALFFLTCLPSIASDYYYLLDFETKSGVGETLSRQLTLDFQESLMFYRCIKLVDRMDKDLIEKNKGSEYRGVLNDISNLDPNLVRILKEKKAKGIIVGSVDYDANSGEYIVLVKAQEFSTETVGMSSVWFNRGKSADVGTRKNLMRDLAKNLCAFFRDSGPVIEEPSKPNSFLPEKKLEALNTVLKEVNALPIESNAYKLMSIMEEYKNNKNLLKEDEEKGQYVANFAIEMFKNYQKASSIYTNNRHYYSPSGRERLDSLKAKVDELRKETITKGSKGLPPGNSLGQSFTAVIGFFKELFKITKQELVAISK